jgi:hypothetical protein
MDRGQRGGGRGLRVSSHVEGGYLVLSTWKDNVCVSTVRLLPDEAAELVAGLAERAGPARRARRRERAPPHVRVRLPAEEPAAGPWRAVPLPALLDLVLAAAGSPAGRPRIVGRRAGESTLADRLQQHPAAVSRSGPPDVTALCPIEERGAPHPTRPGGRRAVFRAL